MDDVKRTYREAEQATKEAVRDADGDESLTDKIGNAGDELRKDAGNAGDDLERTTKASMDRARRASRAADGDDSVADKVGNAGDDIRREMDPSR
jgi:hypothetical protein